MQKVYFSSFIINKTLKWENAELCLSEEATVWVCCWCYVAFIMCLKETQRSHHSALPPGRNTQESLWVCYVLYMQLLSVNFSFEALLLLTVHQGFIFRVEDEPSSDPIRHEETISPWSFPVTICSPK